MKKILVVLIVLLTPVKAISSPFSDVVVGIAMISVGGVFEMQKEYYSNKADKSYADTQADNNSYNSLIANANYYNGAALVQLQLHNDLDSYRQYNGLYINYMYQATVKADSRAKNNGEYEDYRNKKNLYAGVSYTVFGVGSIMVVKGLIGYIAQNRMKKSWVKHIDLEPRIDGVRLNYVLGF